MSPRNEGGGKPPYGKDGPRQYGGRGGRPSSGGPGRSPGGTGGPGRGPGGSGGTGGPGRGSRPPSRFDEGFRNRDRPRYEGPGRERDDRPPTWRDRDDRGGSRPPREGDYPRREPRGEREGNYERPQRPAPREGGYEETERPVRREVLFDQTERPRRAPRGDVAGPQMVRQEEIPAEELSRSAEKIAAAALEVHRQLGSALEPVVYQRALAVEMQSRGLGFMRDERVPIAYKGRQIDTRRVDFVVEGCLVEVHSQSSVSAEVALRASNYLRAAGYGCTVLLNFGGARVETRTLMHERAKDGE